MVLDSPRVEVQTIIRLEHYSVDMLTFYTFFR